MSTFTELGLNEEILKALTDLGYEKPSEIQEKAIPQVISSTDDFKAFAQTGTGKTAAFSLPVLQLLNRKQEAHKQSSFLQQENWLFKLETTSKIFQNT